MRPPRNQWPATELAMRGLYLAQTIQLLLDDDAYESFRVQSLDTVARLEEIEDISQEVSRHNVSHRNIVDPAKEFAETFRADTSAKAIIGENSAYYQEYFFSIDDGKAKQHAEIANIAKLTRIKIASKYRERMESDIINLISSNSYYDEIYPLIQRYTSYLINYGISKRWIRRKLNEFFFDSDILRFDKRRIKRFFKSLPTNERTYEVWIPMNGAISGLLQRFGIDHLAPRPLSALPAKLQAQIRANGQYSENDFYLLAEEDDYDPYKACNRAALLPRVLRSISILQDRSINLKMRDYGFVRAKGSDDFIECKSNNFRLQKTSEYVSKSYAKLIRSHALTATGKFDVESFERILSSSENVALSRDRASPENQLVIVWSAIETLFGDPPDESNRIDFYLRSLKPCIVINYPWRYARAVFNLLVKSYRRRTEEACDEAQIDNSIDPFARFLYLMFHTENETVREKFIQSLADNPSAKQTLINMNLRFGDVKSLHSSVCRHEDRVHWQISRIYRARNAFIHSGSAPPYIASLAKNSFEYYRTALQSIIHYANEFPGTGSIDMFVHAIEKANHFNKRELVRVAKLTPPHDPNILFQFLKQN